MSGIQVSGLLSNSAFDWKSVVDQLVAVSGTPIKKLNTDKEGNTAQASALAELGTKLTDLQDAVQSMRAKSVFDARTVASDLANTTWKSSSVTGAAIGSYTFDVTQLATQAEWRGGADIGAGLAATDDVSGLTIANLPTATAVTAGTFTVAGQQVTVALTDSLQDVFDAIASATGGGVTAAYDHLADQITLTAGSGELVLGAGNDTSNFLSALKLANDGSGTATSAATVGVVKTTAALVDSGLRSAITAVDGTGAGSFAINGVTIDYNLNTDTLNSVLNRINESGAKVTAVYDSTLDRVVLRNKSTGDVGINLKEGAGGLLDALGLSSTVGGALVHGKNARFAVNGANVLTSTSNTLDSSAHGIAGLSVTVNSETKQTLQVESDAAVMQEGIQNFIEKFNSVQDFIEEITKISVTGANVTTAVLSKNREIQSWASRLRSMAFDAVSGLSGDINRLEHIGIDFDGTTNHLLIKDAGKMATTLGDKPDEVGALFLDADAGLVGQFFDYMTTVTSSGRSQQDLLGQANQHLDEQIATLQSRLDAERETLTNAFIRMLDSQSLAQTQSTYLTNSFFKNNSN